MTQLTARRVHHISTVAAIICALDFQVSAVASPLCLCIGGAVDCYRCQCDHMEVQCGRNTITDCIQEKRCLRGISEHMCTHLGGNRCQMSGCHLEDCSAVFQCTTVDSCNDSATTEAQGGAAETQAVPTVVTWGSPTETQAVPTAETWGSPTTETRASKMAEEEVSTADAAETPTAEWEPPVTAKDELLPNEKQVPTEIVVPAVVCITAITLVGICAVTLALYWKFKIKVIRETKVNTYALPAPPCDEDPLYSVIDTWDAPGYIMEPPQLPPGYTEPPQLPPSRVPHYQAIESGRVAMTSQLYEIPISRVQSSYKEEGANDDENEDEVEPYQEPIAFRGDTITDSNRNL